MATAVNINSSAASGDYDLGGWNLSTGLSCHLLTQSKEVELSPSGVIGPLCPLLAPCWFPPPWSLSHSNHLFPRDFLSQAPWLPSTAHHSGLTQAAHPLLWLNLFLLPRAEAAKVWSDRFCLSSSLLEIGKLKNKTKPKYPRLTDFFFKQEKHLRLCSLGGGHPWVETSWICNWGIGGWALC